MDFKQSARIYLYLFYCIGLSPYRPSNSSKIKYFKCSKYIQAVICDVFSLVSLISMNEGDVLPQQRAAETIIINIYLLCDMARATFILMQCFFFHDLLMEIACYFQEVDKCFIKDLQHRIPYITFRREYRMKFTICMIVVVCYILGFLGRIVVGQYASLASHFTKLLQVMTTFTYLHIILYVQALSFHMNQLNVVIQRDTILNKNIASDDILARMQLCHRLKAFKFIHFRLWAISQRIGHYFGYVMIALFLHAFSDTIYSAFWLYTIIKKAQPLTNLWSKFHVEQFILPQKWTSSFAL